MKVEQHSLYFQEKTLRRHVNFSGICCQPILTNGTLFQESLKFKSSNTWSREQICWFSARGAFFCKCYSSFYYIPQDGYVIQQWSTEIQNSRIMISRNVTLENLPSLKASYLNLQETNISWNPVGSTPYHTNHTSRTITSITWLGLSKAVMQKSLGQFAYSRLSGCTSVYRPQATESSHVPQQQLSHCPWKLGQASVKGIDK